MVRRVAALYDIHGNLPALEAVLAEVAKRDVDLVVVGGDVIPGPWPGETLDRLLALSYPVAFLSGNGEADVLEVSRGAAPTRVPEAVHDTLRWAAESLSAEQLSEIGGWPSTTRVDVEGLGDVLFCHATPRDDNEIFTRLTPDDGLRPIFTAPGAEVVVCGHTHMPFERTIDSVRVVNAGSVGLPFGEPGAYWALLGPDVELLRVTYDVAGTARRVRASDYPAPPGLDLEHPPSEAQMLELFEASALA